MTPSIGHHTPRPGTFGRGSAGQQLLKTIDIGSVTEWFGRCGLTDNKYLETHFTRFRATKDFALPAPGSSRLTILDIGAHWLHNALLFANDGHRLVCVDEPGVLSQPSVVVAAEAMGATLVPSDRLELGRGIDGLPSDSFDIVLFCEIIEHLTFNPIPMWRQIYRVLRPGGRIIITTPNANHWRRLVEHAGRLLQGRAAGYCSATSS